MPCGCGGTAVKIINWRGDCVVKGTERPWKLDERCAPIGWNHGNTSEAQERRYTKIVEETKKLAVANDRKAIKGGVRQIAKVPREVLRLRQNQYGKDYLDPASQSADEIKSKLRSDGLLFHRR